MTCSFTLISFLRTSFYLYVGSICPQRVEPHQPGHQTWAPLFSPASCWLLECLFFLPQLTGTHIQWYLRVTLRANTLWFTRFWLHIIGPGTQGGCTWTLVPCSLGPRQKVYCNHLGRCQCSPSPSCKVMNLMYPTQLLSTLPYAYFREVKVTRPPRNALLPTLLWVGPWKRSLGWVVASSCSGVCLSSSSFCSTFQPLLKHFLFPPA